MPSEPLKQTELVKLKHMTPSIRWERLYRLDMRTLEGQSIIAMKQWLTDYVGGQPDIKQALLIERAAWVSLRIALKERKLLQKGIEAMTLHDDLHYMSWVNTLTKILKQLKPPDVTVANTADYETILKEIRGTLMEAA